MSEPSHPSVNAADQYREYWAYVRHTESVRNSAVRWYLIACAALGGLAAPGATDALPIPRIALNSPVVLTFLLLYSAFMAAYLVQQKTNYDKYVAKLFELDGHGQPKSSVLGGTFAWYYYTIILVGAVVAGLWAHSVWNLDEATRVALQTDTRAIVAAVVFFLVAFLYNLIRRWPGGGGIE